MLMTSGAQFDQQVATGEIGMRDMWNRTWAVNTTSTWMITHALMPLLLKSADPRLIFMTSATATLTGHGNQVLKVNQSPEAGWPKKEAFIPAYRSAKTGLNMMMREWARILGNDNVKIWSVSPGWLATGLGYGAEKLKAMGAQDPAVGGAFVRDVVEGKRDRDVGKAINKDGIQPW
jgi:NAD(P)-dependent dehydrogenase (short-subunit alcohol dehydrogenase family)